MGYAYDYNRISRETLEVADRLKAAFAKAGLKTTIENRNDHLDITVVNPQSGEQIDLAVSTVTALADGYWATGSVVKAETSSKFNETGPNGLSVAHYFGQNRFSIEVQNLPDDNSLHISMQGKPQDDTDKLAKQAINLLKTPKQ